MYVLSILGIHIILQLLSCLCREAEEEEEEEEQLEMSPMCMLTDDMLPLDAASIKRKQARLKLTLC